MISADFSTKIIVRTFAKTITKNNICEFQSERSVHILVDYKLLPTL